MECLSKSDGVLEQVRWSEKELLAYDRVAMGVLDTLGALSAARKEGLEEGEKQGIAKMALQMLKKGMSIEEVIELSGLDPSEIASLAQNKHTLKT